MLSYVFLTVLDLPARFISVTLHVDKSLKMAAKLGDCRKLGNFLEEARVSMVLNDCNLSCKIVKTAFCPRSV